MDSRLLERALIQIATFFVLLTGLFFGYAEVATYRGKSKAEALCKAVPIGSSAESAKAIILKFEIDPKLNFSSEDQLSVGFRGAFMIERWYCNLKVSNGKVVANEIRLVD